MTSFIIGVDVGGTFTDLVAIDAQGATTFAKSLGTRLSQQIRSSSSLTTTTQLLA